MMSWTGVKVAAVRALTGIVFARSLAEVSAIGSRDFRCWGTEILDADGGCVVAPACDPSAITFADGIVQIIGSRCKVTMEDIHQQLPDSVSKSGTVYTLNHQLLVTNDCVLEIHGPETATEGAAVTLLQLKSDETSAAPIIAEPGKISILDTVVTSFDASSGSPDERLDGRAYIAVLSFEDDDGVAQTSRMDVERSEISYLGNEGDYHNDIDNDYGLVWKVEGYDDRYPGDLDLFNRVGVYGVLKENKLHHSYMGAYCYGMKGSSLWTNNEVYDNYLNGLNPQDNSDDMTLHSNHVHDNGWHGIEFSKRCLNAEVYDNVVEDNARAGIFFHRSSDNAEAYGNICRRNLEGDFGIVESAGVLVHDNVMEGGKYGIRLSLGADECDVYSNVISDSVRYGVFFFRGSDEAEASADWDGRPRRNKIRNNFISNPEGGQGVAVTGSDDNEILDNIFVDIESMRFEDALNTLVLGNDFEDGVEFSISDGATLAEGSQSGTA